MSLSFDELFSFCVALNELLEPEENGRAR